MTISVLGLDWTLTAWFWIFLTAVTVRNVSEWREWRRHVPDSDQPRQGGVSIWVFNVAYVLSSMATGAWLLLRGGELPWFAAGCVLFLGANRLRMRLLHGPLAGRWSPWTTPRTGAMLQTEGIYARIRHPVYLVGFFESLGLSLICPNPVSWACLVLDTVATLSRIPQEERALEARHGDAYRAYRKRTARFIPGVW
ncbi:MAG: hypothetical protein RL318_2738 [Fibrobacterota bacterium]|jgi:protein-S-isoprenylcysteine O-methyltransferase Ste14